MARLPAPGRLTGRTGVPGAALAAAAALLSGCADPGSTVVVYSSLEDGVHAWIRGAFQEAHPGMRVRFVSLSDADALDRLRAERDEPGADAWLGAASWRMAQAASEGLLQGGAPPWAQEVPGEARDPQGRWTGLLEDPLVLAFGVESVSRSRAPADWVDLLHPRWSGEIVVPDPDGSDAVTALLVRHMWEARARYGEAEQGLDWFARLDAWRRAYAPDAAEALRSVRVGEGRVAIVPLSAAEASRRREAVDYRVPESDTPALVQGVAVVAGAPRRAAAEAFVAWVGSAGARAGLAGASDRIPLAGLGTGPPPEWAARVLPAVRPVLVPADSVADLVDAWVELWRREVRGRATTLF